MGMAEEKSIALVMHNHQPVGNFPEVFEENFRSAYRPFIDILEQFPRIKCHLHYSGPLLEFLVREHPEFVKKLAALAQRDQVRFLGGGFYEPILPLIPEQDRVGQIRKMNDELGNLFGVRPRGAWLTERVWEDCLIESFSECGIEYTLVDEEHLRLAGAKTGRSSFITDFHGLPFRVFSIDYATRHSVPWGKPEEVMEYLLHRPDRGVTVIADDGEKLGSWPGSYAHVYEQGWLKEFFQGILRSGIRTVFLEDAMEEVPPEKVFLPPSGYEALNVWAMSNSDRWKFEYWRESLKDNDLQGLLAKGYFRNFLVKYPESGQLFKRMEQVSALARSDRAKDHVWAAQCNCVYWHGLFGGIYLPFLRQEAYSNLIKAQKECALSFPHSETRDLNQDGINETFVFDGRQNLFFTHKGGAVYEWDLLDPPINLCDTMARRPEIYHRDLDMRGREKIGYDILPRHMFLDRFLGPDTVFQQFEKGQTGEQGDFADGLFQLKSGDNHELEFSREGRVISGAGIHRVRLSKKITIQENQLMLNLTIANHSGRDLECWYGLELNVSFTDSTCASEMRTGASLFRLPGQKVSMVFHCPESGDCWGFPVCTINRTHHIFEEIRQGYCLLWHTRLSLKPDEVWQADFALRRDA
ncbi:MAG: DUF1926 domain-containing protein [Candidatus Wallbacteria bacterium]|nr:DUF1926 domain-containing protein [Candidatus Wallbacteria bacterium]